MTPSGLTDDELLRHYDDLFRQHPATAELAARLQGGDVFWQLEEELEDARTEQAKTEEENAGLREDVDSLALALEDMLEKPSAANAKAARKVLAGLR